VAAAGGVHDEPVEGRGEVVSAGKRKKKRRERARDDIASSFCYTPSWASQFTGPPLLCSPHLTMKGRLTSLRRGEELAAAVPGRRERESGKGCGGDGGGGREESTERKPIRRHMW
jgi:hypothetical protein